MAPMQYKEEETPTQQAVAFLKEHINTDRAKLRAGMRHLWRGSTWVIVTGALRRALKEHETAVHEFLADANELSYSDIVKTALAEAKDPGWWDG